MLNNKPIQKSRLPQDRRGFSLVEVLVALAVAMIGIVAAFDLVNRSLSQSNSAAMRLTAAYLAKEGVEITRNIRDNNFVDVTLDPLLWKTAGGLDQCNDGHKGCRADYDDYVLRKNVNMGADPMIKKSPAGFFNHDVGAPTIYKRKILIDDSNPDFLEVEVVVWWEDRGAPAEISVSSKLYNWWLI